VLNIKRYTCFRLADTYVDGLAAFFVYVVLGLMGLLSIWESHPQILEQHFSRIKSDYLIVYIAEPPKESERSYRLFTEVVGGVILDRDSGYRVLPMYGKLQLSVGKDNNAIAEANNRASYRYGMGLLIPSNFKKVAGPKNPGEFDYAAYLARNQCWHQLYTANDSVVIIGDGYGNPMVSKALAWREQLVDKFSRFIPNA